MGGMGVSVYGRVNSSLIVCVKLFAHLFVGVFIEPRRSYSFDTDSSGYFSGHRRQMDKATVFDCISAGRTSHWSIQFTPVSTHDTGFDTTSLSSIADIRGILEFRFAYVEALLETGSAVRHAWRVSLHRHRGIRYPPPRRR